MSINRYDDSLKEIEKVAKINNKIKEYEEFVKNNPCNTVESFANSDIWEVAKYLYQITEPIATLEENKETIDNFKSFVDGIASDLCCGMMAIFDELCSLGIVDEAVDFFEESGVIKGLLKRKLKILVYSFRV